MQRPFPAYQGSEPYVFVCYAHDDASLVYPEITRLKAAGFNIWYDEGVAPGSEWSETIAKHIRNSSVFLYFVTPYSVASEHCRREVNFLLNLERSGALLAVHLVPTVLPDGLSLSLSHRQAILRHQHPMHEYEAKLADAIRRAEREESNWFEHPRRFGVGEWSLDLSNRTLRRGRGERTLEPGALSVLLHLIDRAPDAVSDQELMARTWPGETEGDVLLDQAIAQLRAALEDDGSPPAYIEALPERGYRLVAEVNIAPREAVRAPRHRVRMVARWATAIGTMLALIVAGWIVLRSGPERATVFVEQPENHSQDVSLDQLAAGLRTEFLEQLTRIPTLVVQDSEAGSVYRISGSISPGDGDGLSISLQLSRRGRIVWTQEFSAPRDDHIRNRVAVAEVASESIFRIIDFGRVDGAANEDALLAVMRGFALLTGGRAWGTQDSAQAYADQAVRLDPDFATAYVLKALTYIGAVNDWFGGIPPREGFAAARSLLDQALHIDPEHILALGLSINIKQVDGDWKGAEATAQRILDLASPPPPFVAEYFAYCGRYDEALTIMDRVIQANPLPSSDRNLKAHALILARRYTDAMAVLDKVLETQPDNPRARQHKGMIFDATGRFEDLAKVNPMYEGATSREDVGNAWLRFAKEAERGERPILPEKIWRFYVMGYAHLGDHSAAVTWLARGWAQSDVHELLSMRSYPFTGFDEMRATTEYRELMDRQIGGHPTTCPGYLGERGGRRSASASDAARSE